MPAFLVVIPTIRQDQRGFEDVMLRVRQSFTQPTEFHILDGSKGKPAALNLALDHLVARSSCDFYVTMDDDYVPGEGWQDRVADALQEFSELGAVSLWVGDDPEAQKLIGAERVLAPENRAGVTVRKNERGHHIAGACIAYRRDVAIQVGKQPITSQKYQVWEDAWRGRKIQSLGYELGFVEGATPEFIWYDDPPEYDAWRKEQVAQSRKDQDYYLATSGIPDPVSVRIRRWVAKVRGRAKE